MRRTKSRVALALIAMCAIAAVVSAVAGPAASAASVSLTQKERQVIRLVNAQRKAHGLAPLGAHGCLVRAARGHSRAMARVPFFSHVSPSGSTPSERCCSSGYSPQGGKRWCVGETIAWGTGPLASPAAIVRSWMKSPPHRSILLTTEYRDVGVGIARGTYHSRSVLLNNVTYFTLDVGLRR